MMPVCCHLQMIVDSMDFFSLRKTIVVLMLMLLYCCPLVIYMSSRLSRGITDQFDQNSGKTNDLQEPEDVLEKSGRYDDPSG